MYDPDRFVIRYLDGTTTASPFRAVDAAERRAGLHTLGRQSVPTGRLLAALSTALDLTEGQLAGHSLRTCYLAMRLADAAGLPSADREALFYAAFLKDAGCSSNAAAVTRIFGSDEIALKTRQSTTERGILAYAAMTMRSLPTTEPLPLRLRRLIAIGIRGRRERHEMEQIRCERGAAIARKAGFDDSVGDAILDLHEHWDGGGEPRGLRGAAIHPLARILAACQGLDIFLNATGPANALSVIAARRGTWYEPDVVDALLEASTHGLLDDLNAPDLVGRTMRSSRAGRSGRRMTRRSIGSRAPSRTSSMRRVRSPARTRSGLPISRNRWPLTWASHCPPSSMCGEPASSTTWASSVSRTSSSTSRDDWIRPSWRSSAGTPS